MPKLNWHYTRASALIGLFLCLNIYPAQGQGAGSGPRTSTLVPGSVIHAVEGIAFGNDGFLYGTSIHAQVVYKIDTRTGVVTIAVPSPIGESDDIDVGPANTKAADILAWTAQSTGEIRIQRPGQKPETILKDVPRVNPIVFSPEGRLFTSQVGAGDDTLWELDVIGSKPPRRVLAQQGALNGFSFGPDGRIYAPLFRTDKLVAIDVDTGKQEVVAEGVGTSAAVEVDDSGMIYSIDYLKGDVWKSDLKTKASRIIANFPDDVLDNLDIGNDGLLYLASVADSRILTLDPITGEKRTIVDGRFTIALGASSTTLNGKSAIIVADPFGYRFVDPATGAVTRPAWEANRGASSDVAANSKVIAFSYSGSNRVRVIDRATNKVDLESNAIGAPRGVVIDGQGRVLVADAKGGRIVTLDKAGVRDVANGLRQPVALAIDGSQHVLVTEYDAGTIQRVDLQTGLIKEVASGLMKPTGVARLKDGRVAVVEPDKGTVIAIKEGTGERQVLASGLALSIASFHLPLNTNNGIAVTDEGDVIVTCPGDNSIVKIDL